MIAYLQHQDRSLRHLFCATDPNGGGGHEGLQERGLVMAGTSWWQGMMT
jgi:hypothetical protein